MLAEPARDLLLNMNLEENRLMFQCAWFFPNISELTSNLQAIISQIP
jgi:hypothetical protein